MSTEISLVNKQAPGQCIRHSPKSLFLSQKNSQVWCRETFWRCRRFPTTSVEASLPTPTPTFRRRPWRRSSSSIPGWTVGPRSTTTTNSWMKFLQGFCTKIICFYGWMPVAEIYFAFFCLGSRVSLFGWVMSFYIQKTRLWLHESVAWSIITY